jgi:UDP-glucose 4-epimerase
MDGVGTAMTAEYWSGKRVTVTGAAGFIGSHLTERLAALGAQVSALDRTALSLGREDDEGFRPIVPVIVDLELFDWTRHFVQVCPDAVFHLAGTSSVSLSIESPTVDFETNVVQTVRILDAARVTGFSGAVIYQSSAAVYGRPKRLPVQEGDPTEPISPYGVAKLACDRYLAVYSELYGLRGASLRAFSVYGARQRKLFVYDMMRRIAETPERIWVSGDGEQKRDFIHVDDVVSALLLVAAKGPLTGEVYNVATGESRSINEVLASLVCLMGATPPDVEKRPTRDGDPEEWSADTARLRSLGFIPQVSLEDGLKRTVEWYRISQRDS